jgi:tyrosyl-tRNA synthetase
VHSSADYDFAVKASEILFGNATTEVLQSLNENELLQVMEGVPTAKMSKASLANGYDLIDLLVETNIFPSKGEAKKMFVAGGLGLNKTKIAPEKTTLNTDDLLQGKYLLLQKGKKNYYLVIAE